MNICRTLTVTLIVLLLCSPSVSAQRQQEHIFFWFSVGAGAGANLSTGLEDERQFGGAGYIRVGAALTQRFLFGVEFLAWARRSQTDPTTDPVTIQRSNPSILLMFYPSDMGGLFFKVGASGAYVDIEESGRKVTERGTGARAGIGYDIKLSHVYLTPNLDWMYQTVEPTVGAKNTNHMVLATLGITWH